MQVADMIRYDRSTGRWLDWIAPFGGGKAPAAPDPYATAAAQGKLNQQTAAQNNAISHGNTVTPFGSQTYTPRRDQNTGDIVYDSAITLDPAQQQLLDQQNSQNLRLGNTANNMIDQVDVAYNRPISTETLPALQGDLSGGGGPGLQGSINTAGIPGLQSSINTSGVPGLQSDVDFSGLPQLFGANDLQGARRSVSDALYRQKAGYLDPQYAQRDTAMRTRLANQGITEGSEAWKNSIDEFDRGRAFDYGQARDSAISGGGDELTRLVDIAQGNRGQLANERLAGGNFRNDANQQGFGQATAQGEFGNDANQQGFGQAAQSGAFQNSAHAQSISDALARATLANRTRAQGLDETLALRNQPLNELTALRSATPVNMPQFSGQGTGGSPVANTDLSGNIWNAYQRNLANWQQGQQNANATNSGLFSLAAAAMMMSDERLKTDIEPVGTIGRGMNLYDYEYKDEPGVKYRGLLAQEVEQAEPDAVATMGNGYKAVDYHKVLARALKRRAA